MRLIDWDNVLEWMHRQKETTEQWSMRIAIENYVDEMPTIDPVQHGRWEYKNGGWHCSLCDEQAPFWCMASTQNLSNYCPHCGAKMDEEG